MELLQIVLRQHCDICAGYNNGLIWDFLKDFVLPLVIAGLAAYTAYYIFIKESKRDRAKEATKLQRAQNDKIKYFSALVQSAFSSSKSQLENIDENIKLLEQDNISFHYLRQVPMYDLKRVNENTNLEDFLLAYTYRFRDHENPVKHFKRILSSIDYLYLEFLLLQDQWGKAQKFDYERKLKLKDLFKDSFDLYDDIMLQNIGNINPLLKELTEVKEKMEANYREDKYDIQFHYDYFFTPINQVVGKYIGTPQLPQIMITLGRLTRDGKSIFEHIRSENSYLLEQLKQIRIKVKESIDELEATSTGLRKIIDETGKNKI
jgi:hypothetical protein